MQCRRDGEGEREVYYGSEMERRVTKQLLMDERLTGAYRDKIVQCIEHFFAEKWDPNCAPEVKTVGFELHRENAFVVFRVNADAQFAYWKAQYWGRFEVRFDWERCQTEEELTAQIRALLPELAEGLSERVVQSLPVKVEEELRWRARLHLDEFGQTERALASHPGLAALLGERLPAIQAAYEAQLLKTPCPAGFRPAHVASLGLRCKAGCERWEIALLIRMDNGVYSEKKIAFNPGSCAFYLDPVKRVEALYSQAKDRVEVLLQRAVRVPLLYTASSLRDLPGMTDPLQTLLEQGAVPLGCVTVQWDGPQFGAGPLLYQPRQDRGKVRFGRDGEGILNCPAVPLYPELLAKQQDASHDWKTLTQDLPGVCRLGESLQEILEKTFQGTGVPVPPVKLLTDKKLNLTICWSTRKAALDPTGESLEMALQRTAERIFRDEIARPAEREAQRKVLNCLDTTELTVLRYVTEHGETYYTEAAREIDRQKVSTPKPYTQECLNHLTEVEVPVEGKATPLLRTRKAYNSYGWFYKYSVEALIEPEVLQAAVGRPFTPADLERMKPKARGKWFSRYLLEADEGQRWTRFNEALDCMDGAFLKAFVLTEEGQAFLRKFTGDEAVFVRLTVEALPGCKRLAARLWPEEDGAKAERRSKAVLRSRGGKGRRHVQEEQGKPAMLFSTPTTGTQRNSGMPSIPTSRRARRGF